MRVRIDDCVIDTECRQVFRGEQEVRLSPKAYLLLQTLLEERPRAVAKEDLYRRLWPDTFVVEANLPNLISEIRTALGDSSHQPRIIRTLHGFGYAFSGHAEVLRADGRPDGASISLHLQDGRELRLCTGENIVGRGPDALLRLDAPGISRRHARIVVDGEGTAVIEDLGSKNGTFVQGERLAAARRLASGDAVAFGPVRVTFLAAAPAGSTETIVVE